MSELKKYRVFKGGTSTAVIEANNFTIENGGVLVFWSEKYALRAYAEGCWVSVMPEPESSK